MRAILHNVEDWLSILRENVIVRACKCYQGFAGQGIKQRIAGVRMDDPARNAPILQGMLAAMQRLNSALSKDVGEGRFVTFVAVLCTPGSSRVELLSAGHGPLFLYSLREDRFDAMSAQGLPLGLIPDMVSEPPKALDLRPGDLLVLTTDGFFEWANEKDEQFGVKRMEDTIRAARDKSPAEVITTLYKAVVEFSCGTKQADDLTAIIIKKN